MLTVRFKNALARWIPELENQLSTDFKYHNVDHTLSVLEYCRLLAEDEKLNTEEIEILLFAALFHDYGFIKSPIEHEVTGAKMAAEYCKTIDFSEEEIKQIEDLILATKWPQVPTNHLSEIICDADLAYLGTLEYPRIANGLREERTILGFPFTDEAWFNLQISFLKEHQFFTESAKKRFQAQKEIFLDELIKSKQA